MGAVTKIFGVSVGASGGGSVSVPDPVPVGGVAKFAKTITDEKLYMPTGEVYLRSGYMETDPNEYDVEFWDKHGNVSELVYDRATKYIDTNDFGNSTIYRIATDNKGTWIAVGGSGKCVKYTNRGYTVEHKDIGFSTSAIYSIATDEKGTWIAVGASGKAAISTDNGDTWNMLPMNFDTDVIRGIDTDGSGRWIAVGDKERISTSTSNGQSWSGTTARSGSSYHNFVDIATDRKGKWAYIANRQTTGNWCKFYVSTNDGYSWTNDTFNSSIGLTVNRIATDRKNDRWVITASQGYVYIALNGNTGPRSTGLSGYVYGVASDGNGNWIVGSGGGAIAKATGDDMNIWSVTNLGTTSTVYAIAAEMVSGAGWWYVGIGSQLIFMNSGTTTAGGNLGFGTSDVSAIASFGDGRWLIAGDTASKVSVSGDNGASWKRSLSAFVGTSEMYGITKINDDGGVIVYGSGALAVVSYDEGSSWHASDLFFGSDSIRGVASDGKGILVAVGASGKAAISTDNGTSWDSVNVGFGTTAINAVATDTKGTWIAVGASGKAAISTDNGTSWDSVNVGFGTTAINAVATDAKGTWVVVGASGMGGRSIDGGMNWTYIALKAGTGTAYGVGMIGGERWLVGGAPWSLSMSTNSAGTWGNLSLWTYGDVKTERIFRSGKGIYICIGLRGSVSYISSSVDCGLTWEQKSISFSDQIVDMDTDSDGVWIAVGNGNNRVSISLNDGASWSSKNISVLSGKPAYSVASGNRGVWCIGSTGGMLLWSTSSGEEWLASDLSAILDNIWLIRYNRIANIWIIHGKLGSALYSYISEDGGKSWQALNMGFGTSKITLLECDNTGTWVAATEDGKISISTNGRGWRRLTNLGFTANNIVTGIAYDNNGNWVLGGSVGYITAAKKLQGPFLYPEQSDEVTTTYMRIK